MRRLLKKSVWIGIGNAILFLMALGWTLAQGSSDGSRVKIVVIKTRDIPFYNPTVQGFTNGLKSRGYSGKGKLDLKVVALSGKEDADTRLVQSILADKPQLVVTMGTDATRQVAEQKPTLPVLFSMVLDPVALGVAKSLDAPGGNFTGTTLLVSPGKQLDSLIQTAPKTHRIGILYTDQDPTSLAFLEDAKQDAKRLNMELDPIAVKSGQASKEALSQLKADTNALWLIPDPASTGPQALTATLEYARAHHLPILGMSGATVRAGALLALSASLEDLGDVTADMAAHLLDGSDKTSQMRVRGPRRTLLSLNLLTAHDLGIAIPPAVLHLADEVIDKENDKDNEEK
ncbi:MAG TPA: ABC transporter substrate-binding protein [Chthonomonadaceae bacterium]|nr:ABC transporter substrate-binding protein [Chthonomonadaceae bacterium]